MGTNFSCLEEMVHIAAKVAGNISSGCCSYAAGKGGVELVSEIAGGGCTVGLCVGSRVHMVLQES